jgi:hypothetical protein
VGKAVRADRGWSGLVGSGGKLDPKHAPNRQNTLASVGKRLRQVLALFA